jgi:hypothetical protein
MIAALALLLIPPPVEPETVARALPEAVAARRALEARGAGRHGAWPAADRAEIGRRLEDAREYFWHGCVVRALLRTLPTQRPAQAVTNGIMAECAVYRDEYRAWTGLSLRAAGRGDHARAARRQLAGEEARVRARTLAAVVRNCNQTAGPPRTETRPEC